MFEVAEAYEEMMGRWSRQLAPLFVEFVGIRDGEKVLDVGCGTGALSSTLAKLTKAVKIVGIDPANGFIEYARAQINDPRVTFEIGDARALPYTDGSFDTTMALLIVNFVPDAPKAMREMCRVTKSDGIVATTMWDGRANELNRCLWDAALAIDPPMKRPSETGKYGSAERLSGLMQDAGLTNVTVGELNMPCHFSCFDDLWQRNLTGEGPQSAYVLGLQPDHREALKKRLRKNVLGDGPDGPFSLKAKAWAVRGVVL